MSMFEKYLKQLEGHSFKKPIDVSKEEILEQLGGLTKDQLELIGRDYGVELDRRKTKAKLVGEITELLND